MANGETVETVAEFIFLGSRITADGDCSHEIKRCLLLGRKVLTYLDSICKSTDVTLPTKVHLVKAMVFPVVVYGCESWTIKKAEHQRIDAFELWCWRRVLKVPWTLRRSNRSILKEFSPGCSLERLMLKLKLQYFGHLMWHADSLDKTLMLGKIEGRRRKGWQKMRWLAGITDQWTWVWVNNRSCWRTGRPAVLRFMGSQRVGHDWVTELTDWLCFPGGTVAKESACQCRRCKRCRFSPCIGIGKIAWGRKWQPTPVFLPGESHGQRSLAGYCPQGHKQLDKTEVTECVHVHIAPFLRLASGPLFIPLLMSMSEVFSVPFLHFNKTLLHKWSSLVPGPKAKSSSSAITNPTSFTLSYQRQD